MLRITLILLGTLMFYCCIGKSDDEFVGILTFESGFNMDTLSVEINDCLIIDKSIVKSSEVDGITDIQINIYRHGDLFLCKLHGDEDYKCKIGESSTKLQLNTILNGTIESFTIELSKGKYIGINYLDSIIELTQSNDAPLYD